MTSSPTPSPAAAPVPAAELRMVFTGLMLALTLAALDQNIVSTALPRIVSDLGGLAHLSWVVTAFLLTSTTSTPLYGKLSDMYGRKALFYVAIAFFLLGSTLCGLAQTMLQLILFRAVQGLGAGGLFTLAQTTVGDLIPPRERGRYQGLFGAVFATCSVAGPLLGGFITDAFSWRWIFYVNLPVGAAALALIALGLRHPNHEVRHRIDYPGALCLTAATVCTLLFLSWGGVMLPWSSPRLLGLGALAVVFTALLLVRESRAAEPVLPLHLFRDRVFVLGVMIIALNAMALFGSLVFLPLFFQLVLGATASHAGLLMAPMMGGMIVSAVAGGRLVSRSGRYKIYPVIGLGGGVVAFLVMAWAAVRGGSLPVIEAALVLLGGSLGFVMPNVTVAIQNAVERHHLGSATSVSGFLRSLGGAVGVAATGAVVAFRLRQLLPASWGAGLFQGGSPLEMGIQQMAQLPAAQHEILTHAYRHAIATSFLTGAGLGAVAFVLALLLPERPLRAHAGPATGDSPEPVAS